jgi:hypothetical protein
MSEQVQSRVDKFLAGVKKTFTARGGNLIFALDATYSRQATWDTAAQLQAEMFREAAAIGGLNVQLVYYRGTAGSGSGECKASQWVSDPLKLASFMSSIGCIAGETQIAKALNHVVQEAGQRRIGAVVFVGDCCEDDPEAIMRAARRLGQLSVPVFLFQEGRDFVAETVFKDVAKATHGAYRQFDRNSAAQLGELLRAVAAFAAGGVAALERQGSEAAKLLLGQVR